MNEGIHCLHMQNLVRLHSDDFFCIVSPNSSHVFCILWQTDGPKQLQRHSFDYLKLFRYGINSYIFVGASCAYWVWWSITTLRKYEILSNLFDKFIAFKDEYKTARIFQTLAATMVCFLSYPVICRAVRVAQYSIMKSIAFLGLYLMLILSSRSLYRKRYDSMSHQLTYGIALRSNKSIEVSSTILKNCNRKWVRKMNLY